MSVIPTIPPQTSANDLITTLNDRIRRINEALGSSPGAGSGSVGIRYGTLASRPSGLDKQAAGTLYVATDTYQAYWWNGSAWVEVTQANLAQIAYASSPLTLTAADQAVPGASLTLTRSGRHLIWGFFDFLNNGEVNVNLRGRLSADGVTQGGQANFNGANGSSRGTTGQAWLYTAPTAGKVVQLLASEVAGTGTAQVGASHTSISALWIGP